MRTNRSSKGSMATVTHGGGTGANQPALEELTRTVSACLLWENTYYESGSSIAKRIVELSKQVSTEDLAALAVRARTDMKLRHVPLFLAVQLTHHQGKIVGDTIGEVIQRADELGEFCSLYGLSPRGTNKKHQKMLSKQAKRGLEIAFRKFNEYRLAKYDRQDGIRLRDVLFMSHAKPKDDDQAALWKRLIEGTMASPETHENRLSRGEDKKTVFTDLITSKRIGGMAMLMNLRNMEEAGVDRDVIRMGFETANFSRVLPFRFIAAAKAAPKMEDLLEKGMLSGLGQRPRLPGKTLFVIDVSGSMGGLLSAKGTLDRVDGAAGLAILLREVCEDVTIYATAGSDFQVKHATSQLPPRRGFALRDALKEAQSRLGGGGIFLTQAMSFIGSKEGDTFDRSIVFTDEQDTDSDPKRSTSKAPTLAKHAYIVNVASYKPGLDTHGKWERITGFSERIVDWIALEEGITPPEAADDEEQ